MLLLIYLIVYSFILLVIWNVLKIIIRTKHNNYKVKRRISIIAVALLPLWFSIYDQAKLRLYCATNKPVLPSKPIKQPDTLVTFEGSVRNNKKLTYGRDFKYIISPNGGSISDYEKSKEEPDFDEFAVYARGGRLVLGSERERVIEKASLVIGRFYLKHGYVSELIYELRDFRKGRTIAKASWFKVGISNSEAVDFSFKHPFRNLHMFSHGTCETFVDGKSVSTAEELLNKVFGA